MKEVVHMEMSQPRLTPEDKKELEELAQKQGVTLEEEKKDAGGNLAHLSIKSETKQKINEFLKDNKRA